MSKSRNPIGFIGDVFAVLSAASAVAAAVESKRRVGDSDLKVLGIDPSQFRNIRR